jgi:dienelactone hydrolase
MIAPLAKLIEWAHVQSTFRQMPHPDGDLGLDEAIQFLNGPDFMPAESQPAELVFDNASRFHFPTPRPCAFAENNVAHGQLYRCSERWQERPAIILLHGRNENCYRFRFPTIARRCQQAGFNAATLVLPYHVQRHPRQLKGWGGSNYMQIAEATAQGIAEIRALMGWLLKEGCPAVALLGISMGGQYAGWVASCDPRLAAAVMAVPGVGVNVSITERIIWRRVREAMQRQSSTLERFNLTPVNLTWLQPAIPRKNILLIEAIHDWFAPKEDIERLWQAWGQPDIWRLPHSHSTWTGWTRLLPGLHRLHTPGHTDEIIDWLAPRLDMKRTGRLLPV